MRTIKTLEEIIRDESTKARCLNGYKLDAFKSTVLDHMQHYHKTLPQLLEEYVARANKDIFFERGMVYACWQLIQDK